LLLLLSFGCVAAPAPKAESVEEKDEEEHAVVAAVEHPDRPAADRARDGDRKPIEVLRFFDVNPGDTIVELMAGRGWYTEILGRAVGPTGKLYAQNNRYVLEKFAAKALAERLSKPGLSHVTRWDRELDDLALPAGGADRVLLVLFYHDTIWMKVDRAKLNAQIFEALAPGGIYGVVDHHAVAGSKGRDAKTLHRVDVELVKSEILAAGFELAGRSDALAHPEDDRTINVFDERIRGKTDRFVLAFRKPRWTSSRPR
jgi:predicted methyltransferase